MPKALISGWVYASGIIISEPFLCSSQVSEKNEISGLGQGEAVIYSCIVHHLSQTGAMSLVNGDKLNSAFSWLSGLEKSCNPRVSFLI